MLGFICSLPYSNVTAIYEEYVDDMKLSAKKLQVIGGFGQFLMTLQMKITFGSAGTLGHLLLALYVMHTMLV